ncbi:hypothetical protein CN553_29210 [Bacillus cereus]|uniref:Transposase n=1 Tax=Bacillus cereus TaxID=1396 RepID=A0A9X6YJJ3_BACCE|nr:hypothetical protein [Bacillus cereus]PEN81145.1 hypothetical protein CN553_29210 [Bacillus cereus]
MIKFTAEEKITAVQSYLEGIAGYDTIGESIFTIRTWVIQYKHDGVKALQSKLPLKNRHIYTDASLNDRHIEQRVYT